MKKYLLFLTTIMLAAGTVPALAQSGYRYPYVAKNDAGKACVIVSRDAKGGVKASALHPKWTGNTPKHTEQSSDNAVSAKFEVADYMNTYASRMDGDCAAKGAGWRVPTQRELMLIYLLKDRLTGISSIGEFTATNLYGNSYNYIWYMTPSNGYMFANNPFYTRAPGMEEYGSVNCVRDVD